MAGFGDCGEENALEEGGGEAEGRMLEHLEKRHRKPSRGGEMVLAIAYSSGAVVSPIKRMLLSTAGILRLEVRITFSYVQPPPPH